MKGYHDIISAKDMSAFQRASLWGISMHKPPPDDAAFKVVKESETKSDMFKWNAFVSALQVKLKRMLHRTLRQRTGLTGEREVLKAEVTPVFSLIRTLDVSKALDGELWRFATNARDFTTQARSEDMRDDDFKSSVKLVFRCFGIVLGQRVADLHASGPLKGTPDTDPEVRREVTRALLLSRPELQEVTERIRSQGVQRGGDEDQGRGRHKTARWKAEADDLVLEEEETSAT